jgi:hypothetical protein
MIAQNIKKQIVKETRLFDVIIYLCEIIFVKLYEKHKSIQNMIEIIFNFYDNCSIIEPCDFI